MQTMTHTPTGKRCTVMSTKRGGELAFCNFGDAANPFSWVNATELEPADTVTGDAASHAIRAIAAI